MSDVQKQRIDEIRIKSELGRVVKVQANTVHDLLADHRFLLSLLSEKEAEIERPKSKHEPLENHYKLITPRGHELWFPPNSGVTSELLDRLNQAIEALEWYSKQKIVCRPIHCDGGERARQTLQTIKGGETDG